MLRCSPRGFGPIDPPLWELLPTRASARRTQTREGSLERADMQRFTLDVATSGNTDIVNLNPELAPRLREVREDAMLFLFLVGSTAALTTIEFEPGLVKHDLPALFQRLIPDDIR